MSKQIKWKQTKRSSNGVTFIAKVDKRINCQLHLDTDDHCWYWEVGLKNEPQVATADAAPHEGAAKEAAVRAARALVQCIEKGAHHVAA